MKGYHKYEHATLGYCPECGVDHLGMARDRDAFVKCPVRSCYAYTAHASGVCSPETWDEAHAAHMQQRERGAA